MLLIINRKTWKSYVISPDGYLRYELGEVTSLAQAVMLADQYCNFIKCQNLKPERWGFEGEHALQIQGPKRY